VAFDGQAVESLDDLHRALTEARIGTTVTIAVLRGAERREIEVYVHERS
jgi:S1-C subfamily serine protease